jgi:hypothetical protein
MLDEVKKPRSAGACPAKRRPNAQSTSTISRPNRVLKNKHQAVSQGAWRFGKRSISADM